MQRPRPLVLEIERTLLRPFSVDDVEAAFEWFSDPEVMRFIPFGPDADHKATLARINRYMDHERTRGFSKWIVIDRDSGLPIGDAGFFLMPDQKRVELGYRLDRRYWGKGLATEIASKWLEVAQSWYGLKQVFAFAHPDNAASSRILHKLGFHFSHAETLYGMDVPVYAIDLSDAKSPS